MIKHLWKILLTTLPIILLFFTTELGSAWVSPSYITVIKYQPSIQTADIAASYNTHKFMEVWREYSGGGEYTIQGRILDLYGNYVTPEFNINQYDDSYHPKVASAVDGTYWIVVWEQRWSNGNGIKACRVNQDGSKPWCRWIQNDILNLENLTPDIGVDWLSGWFLIVWSDETLLGFEVKGQFIDGNNNLGPQITIGRGYYPSVTQMARDFFVVYQTNFEEPTSLIKGRYIENDGDMPYSEILLSENSGYNAAPDVAGPFLTTGPYVVVWHKKYDMNDYDIFYAVTSSSARQRRGTIFNSNNIEYNPSISFLRRSDRYVVNYATVANGQWNGDWNIHAQSLMTDGGVEAPEVVANMPGCEGTPVSSFSANGIVVMSWDRCNSGELYAKVYSDNSLIPSIPIIEDATDGVSYDYVYIRWNDTSNEENYQVFRCTSTLTSSCGSPVGSPIHNFYYDTGGTPGVIYYYRVKACNGFGCSDYSDYNEGYRAVSPPAIPTGVNATDGTYSDRVVVSWSDVSGEDSYQVYRCTSTSTGSCGLEIGITGANSTSYNDTGGTPGVIYYYRVKACKGAACSDYSGYNEGYRSIFNPLFYTYLPMVLNNQVQDGEYTFAYEDFSSIEGLVLQSDAQVISKRLRISPSSFEKHGEVWFTQQVYVNNGFTTTFQFQITQLVGGGADALAFVVQNSLEGANWSSKFYYIPNSVVVELDTFHNYQLNDPNDNHISVQSLGTGPNSAHHDYSLGSTTSIPNMSDGNVHTVKIDYMPGTMKIYMDNLSTPVLTVAIDLAKKINLNQGKAWVGLCAFGDAAYENHDLLNWFFKSIVIK